MTVTAEYQVRPPMAPTHFFLIDVSQVRCGAWGGVGLGNELGALACGHASGAILGGELLAWVAGRWLQH